MREFIGKGYSWRVETLHNREQQESSSSLLDETHTRKAFELFWGEQYEWTSMLPLSWKLLGTTDTRIRPSSSPSERDPGWWFTPLHLLGLGLGWTDIGKGLYEWQRQGYPNGAHPVLDFVYNTWGESISALQFWLRCSSFAENDIEQPLRELRDFPVDSFRLAPIEENSIRAAYDDQIRLLKAKGNGGRRLDLAKKLLAGDSDTFHLSTHFPGSVWPNEDENHIGFVSSDYAEENNDAFAINPEEHLWEAHFERYAGFHVQLNALAAGLMTGEVFSGRESVRVHIKNFGFLGEFTKHSVSRRWYLSDKTDEYGEEDAHLWGN